MDIRVKKAVCIPCQSAKISGYLCDLCVRPRKKGITADGCELGGDGWSCASIAASVMNATNQRIHPIGMLSPWCFRRGPVPGRGIVCLSRGVKQPCATGVANVAASGDGHSPFPFFDQFFAIHNFAFPICVFPLSTISYRASTFQHHSLLTYGVASINNT
jgi:hypothetical protein